MFCVGFLFVLAIGLVHGDVCSYVNTRDCKTVPAEILCGTNGVSYDNNCFLAKAYCADNTIHKAHDGACATSTTPSPVHGSQIALDIFCLDLIYITCPSGGSKICGSDGTFYENICEFDKARCFHRTLQDNGINCS
ncbi:ovomucoid-like isoform X2 [Ruditapes philippinarum]|uniref:ovomucoid-like isoform X2 n=1 Tax=Ruditapes philippinarum TaxID=129788 RepID=UPI00295C0F70|nr:ovomucoid-like isoform X2 [Ruditapes philippinarum]